MKKQLLTAALGIAAIAASAQTLPITKIYTYYTGIFDGGGSEIVAFDYTVNQLYSTNGSENKIDIINIDNPEKAYLVKQVDLSNYIAGVNSVAAKNGYFVVAGEPNDPQASGKLLFFDDQGTYLNQLQAGAMPDMVTFSPGGNYVLSANEGEPSSNYLSDPVGSISIVDFNSGNPATLSQANVTTIDFTAYDTLNFSSSIRVFGNNGLQLPSQDFEPEYIAIDSAGTKAWVVLQENNAMAVIDLATKTIDTVFPLGFKDFSLAANQLDASDKASSIQFANYNNLFGMYQPDAITYFSVGGKNYIASANEGDSRDYSAYSEEERVKDLNLNASSFPNASALQGDNQLGRLKVTTSMGDNDNNGNYDSLFVYGARSFSIWDVDADTLLWDSGDEFEKTIALLEPNYFNCGNDDKDLKSRSDDKGPEPEAIAVGEIDGTLYAFIGLERMGGIMIYDISTPSAPTFVSYELNRDFTKAVNDSLHGDLGPECVTFIPKRQSPNNNAMIAVSNEISGTVTLYALGNYVSLPNTEDFEELSVYPNPSNGIYYLQNNSKINIYDTQGKLIRENLSTTDAIDITDQPKGYYIVKDEKGNVTRIIKN